jgi:LacI family transcriptional regulator
LPSPRVQRHIIFLEELRRHSDREVCLGAAEYASEHPAWVFDPWPISLAQGDAPALADLRMVDGILTTERSMGEVPALRRRRIPLVYCLADKLHAHADAASVDELAVGAMAAGHLWDRGYRHFAFIGSTATGWSQQRARGFSQVLDHAESPPKVHLFSPKELPVYWSWNLAQRHARLLELLAALPRPCGIFAANDVIACFVLQAARQIGRRIPEDFGVIGVDNDPFPNAAAGLAISSIELPFREIGRAAARLLAERWQGAAPGRLVRLPPIRVIVRTSTDAFMAQDVFVRKAQAYVEAHRHQRVTVNEVTRAVGTNRVTLGKHFQRELAATPLDYIRRRRLAYAVECLRQGDATVDEVAFRCGFSSASYFSRMLAKETGQRPGSIRRAAGGESAD